MRWLGLLLLLAAPIAAQEDEIKLLKSPNSIERRLAAQALGRQKAEAAVPALIATLDDRNPLVRGAAILALGEIGSAEAVDPLAALLSSPDTRTAVLSAKSLARIGELSLPALRRVLAEKGPGCGPAAEACFLLETGAESARPELVAALDTEPATRAVVARALLKIDPTDTAARDTLHALLTRPGEIVVSQAIEGLYGASDQKTIELLAQVLRRPEEPLRWKAARALGRLGPAAKPAIPALVAALKESHAHVRTAAAEALGRIGPASLPALFVLLDDDVLTGYVAHACKAMPEAAVPRLVARMPDRHAARVLGALGENAEAALPVLRRALGNRDPRVRLESARAVWLIAKDAGIVAVLLPLLRSPAADQRRRVALMLGAMGAAAKDAKVALQAATQDADAGVRRAATRALRRIG